MLAQTPPSTSICFLLPLSSSPPTPFLVLHTSGNVPRRKLICFTGPFKHPNVFTYYLLVLRLNLAFVCSVHVGNTGI